MDRFFGRLIVVFAVLCAFSTVASAQTYPGCANWEGQWAWCQSLVPVYANNPNGPAHCETVPTPPTMLIGEVRLIGRTSTLGLRSYNCQTPPEAECEAGSDPFFGAAAGDATEICQDGCAYTCAHESGQCASFDLNNGQGMRTYGNWSQSGETCGGEDDPPPDDDCQDLGASGFEFCPSDPPGCVRSPAGALLCPDLPGPDCATAPSGAACSNQPPPEGYGPPEPFTICPPGMPCIPITVAPPEDDDECDPETDPECEEPPPDCPANDPNCEEDDECPEGFEGTPPFCEKEDNDGVCTEDNQTVCDILRDIREATQGTESNTALQLREDREANNKLTAIKNQATMDARVALAATNRVQVAADATRQAVNNAAIGIKASTSSAASTVANAIANAQTQSNTNTTTLAGKIDALKGAIDGASQCGGVGEPSCSTAGGDGTADIVNAINDPDWAHVEPEDAGEGVTPEDIAAATLNSINIGEDDVDEGGFGIGSACPAFPQGMMMEIDPVFWCDFLSIVRAVMLLLGAWFAVQILLGGR